MFYVIVFHQQYKDSPPPFALSLNEVFFYIARAFQIGIHHGKLCKTYLKYYSLNF